jgi:tRNA nucleotidyltransferase (CCA-adding enzyme)
VTELGGVLAEAAMRVTPTSHQRVRLALIVEKVMGKVRLAAQRFPKVREVLVGGSFAKNTWLPEEADIDIFVKLAPDVDAATFERVGLKVGREAARGYRFGKKYAQHPYTEATVDGVKVNIVPCYDVKPGEWMSAADRSPYHIRFVLENLDEGKRLEVRLLKRFMKVIGVYGAEIENEGFSGYVAEVLVHRHGGFEGVLRHFSELRLAKDGRISLPDPVDEKRDLAKAISTESVARMVLASRAFLGRPQLEFFIKAKKRVRAKLKNRLYAIVFEHRELSEDVLWGELKRSTKHLVRHLEEKGFHIARALAASDNQRRSAFVLLPETEALAEIEQRSGPRADLEKETRRFITLNSRKAELVWAGEDGRIRMVQHRPQTQLSEVLQAVLSSEIRKFGASRDVIGGVLKTGVLLRGQQLERAARKEAWLGEGTEEIVSDTIGTNLDG